MLNVRISVESISLYKPDGQKDIHLYLVGGYSPHQLTFKDTESRNAMIKELDAICKVPEKSLSENLNL